MGLGRILRTILRYGGLAAAAALWLAGAVPAGAQTAPQTGAPAGPQTPVKIPEITRIPSTGDASVQQPPIPVDEIIRRFTEQESQLAKIAAGYGYRKSVRIEEFGPDGKANGQSEVTLTMGQRATGEQQSTLRLLNLDRDVLQALSQIPAFPLKSELRANYQITYQGMAPVDELTTYVFRVTPAHLDRRQGYFDGLVWVDNHDLAIVKTYGKWMTDVGPVSPPETPFIMYESYREPVANKYWFPAYSRSDGMVATKTGNVPVRLVIRWDKFEVAKPGQVPASSNDDSDAPHLQRGGAGQ